MLSLPNQSCSYIQLFTFFLCEKLIGKLLDRCENSFTAQLPLRYCNCVLFSCQAPNSQGTTMFFVQIVASSLAQRVKSQLPIVLYKSFHCAAPLILVQYSWANRSLHLCWIFVESPCFHLFVTLPCASSLCKGRSLFLKEEHEPGPQPADTLRGHKLIVACCCTQRSTCFWKFRGPGCLHPGCGPGANTLVSLQITFLKITHSTAQMRDVRCDEKSKKYLVIVLGAFSSRWSGLAFRSAIGCLQNCWSSLKRSLYINTRVHSDRPVLLSQRFSGGISCWLQ